MSFERAPYAYSNHASCVRKPCGALQQTRKIAVCKLLIHGTPETNRTSDLPLRRGLLYPLSYRGVKRHFTVKSALSWL